MVFWGAAIVLFLVKWINLHDPYLQVSRAARALPFVLTILLKGFWVEISAQIVNALFTVQGVGFLPWRIMDTWNIGWIYYFKRRTRQLRSQGKLPPLADEDDIPDPLVDPAIEFQVLGDRELKKLRYRELHSCESILDDVHSSAGIQIKPSSCTIRLGIGHMGQIRTKHSRLSEFGRNIP